MDQMKGEKGVLVGEILGKYIILYLSCGGGVIKVWVY
jgi:hypothetical protein